MSAIAEQMKFRGMRQASEKHRQALLVAQFLAQMLGAQHGRPISIGRWISTWRKRGKNAGQKK